MLEQLSPMSWSALGLAASCAALLCLVLSALLERSGPIRLRAWAEEADSQILDVFDTPARFEVFRFLLSVAARLGILILLLLLREAWGAWGLRGQGVAALALVTGLVIAAEGINRLLVGSDAHNAEVGLRRLTPFYRAALFLLAPLTLLFAPVLRLKREAPVSDEPEGGAEASAEELEAFLDVGTREGILDPGEEDLVRGVVDLGDKVVRSVMVPRIDVVAAPAEASVDDLAKLLATTKHTRIPIYQESIDQVVGILHVIDLVEALHAAPHPPPVARDLAKPPFVVPETKPLDELLRDFQAHGQQMAVVVDEHGGTSGLVTLEDLLEEIVGEIGDEYDQRAPQSVPLPGGAWRLAGSAPLAELEDRFGIESEPAPYETVGGLVLAAVGRVPRVGDAAEARGLRFTVEGLAGRRVETVRVERLPEVPVSPQSPAR